MGYPGNKTELFKIATSQTGVLPPAGRHFSEIHVAVGGVLTLEGHGLYQYYGESAAKRSLFKSSFHTGKMDAGDNVVASITAVEAAEVAAITSADTSGTVTVTRNGVDFTSAVTAPAFSGILYDGSGVVSVCLVTATVGANLEVGDVISFPLAVNTNLSLSFTLAEDDLDLAAGYYQKKTPDAVALTVVAGEVLHCVATKITTDATAVVAAYLG